MNYNFGNNSTNQFTSGLDRIKRINTWEYRIPELLINGNYISSFDYAKTFLREMIPTIKKLKREDLLDGCLNKQKIIEKKLLRFERKKRFWYDTFKVKKLNGIKFLIEDFDTTLKLIKSDIGLLEKKSTDPFVIDTAQEIDESIFLNQ